MRFEFDWDPAKAESNRLKRGALSKKPWASLAKRTERLAAWLLSYGNIGDTI